MAAAAGQEYLFQILDLRLLIYRLLLKKKIKKGQGEYGLDS